MTLSRVSVIARLGALVLLAASLAGCGSSNFRVAETTDEHECMARVMYFESNRSSDDGMMAVGTVVMNRLKSGRYPHTVCGVVGQPNQFAPGALTAAWGGVGRDRAERMASVVMAGQRHSGVGDAMFFHTAGLTFPYRNMHYVVVAGGNAFYEKRAPGDFTPSAGQAWAWSNPGRMPRLPDEAYKPAVAAAPSPVRVAALDFPQPRPPRRTARAAEASPPMQADVLGVDQAILDQQVPESLAPEPSPVARQRSARSADSRDGLVQQATVQLPAPRASTLRLPRPRPMMQDNGDDLDTLLD